jgi:phosphoketolase
MFTFDTAISSAVKTTDAISQVPVMPAAGPLAPKLLDRMHRYWQAANYLTIGQIYLQENPLLRDSLRPEHIKPRLLGHWGTSPGLSLIYVHLNRLITEHDANVIFLAGPGHGGPAVIANVYLEGTYSEAYPNVSQDIDGMRRLFRRFSTPGGVPSHVSVPTPGSIHEGGELGYVLAHAFGAAFDNPDLIVAAVVGDGEAETGPLSGSWKSVEYLNAARDGAVLPILHLNDYKIAGPTALGRSSDEDVKSLLEATGYEPPCWRNDHNGFGHQGAGLIDVILSKRGTVTRIYLPPDANCLVSVVDHCLRSRNYVNVVDLMALFPPEVHPHGMSESQFLDLFTADKPVIFAFHSYQRALHAIVHGRPRADRFHVRGFNEQGTTTTPFQMVVLNEISRYHIAMAALQRANRSDIAASVLIQRCRTALDSATAYAHAHFGDPPEIRDWVWNDASKTGNDRS